MKSDGDAMETTEPIEAVPDPSSTEEAALEQAPSQPEPANDAAPATNLKANGKPLAADPKTKPKVALNKPMAKSTGASANNSRPGAAPQRGVNDVKALNSAPARKTTTAAKSSSAAGAVPKRPMGVAAVTPAVKTQTKVPEKKPVGQSRTAAVPASPITNGTKQAAVNGAAKMRPGSENPRPKTTTSSRPAASSAPKPNSSTAAKAGVAASSKTNKPLAGPPKARPAPAASRPTTATSKPPTSSAPKTSTVRATTAPPTGKTAVAQPLKTAPPKKDVSRPLSAAAAKKPTGGAAATKKPETSKPTAPAKINSASKLSTVPKASDPKVSQPQNQTDKAIPKKKMPTTARFPANTKPPLGRTPPASPVSKSENSTIQSKGGSKPTQAVLPLTATKKTGYKNMTRPAAQIQRPPDVPLATAPEATVPAEMASEPPESIPQESPLAASVPDTVAPEENTPAEMAREAPPSIPQESLLTAAVQDAVVLAENVATEMAEAPEPIPQELPLTASVAPETNIPAEMAAEAPESIPQELPLTASVAPETNIPAEMAAEAPEPIPQELPLTASVAPETNIPAEMAAEAPESIPHKLPLTASVAPETNIPVEMAEEAPESIPQELSLTPSAPDIVAPETTVSAEVAAEPPSSIPQELSLNAYVQDTVSPEATLPGEVAADAPESTPHEWSLTATVPEEAPHPTEVLTPQLIPEETSQSHSPAPSAPPSSIETALSQPSEVLEHLQGDASSMMMQEQDQPVAAVLVSPSPHDPSDFSQELVLTEQSPSTSEAQDTAENTTPHKVTQCTLNEEEEDEEERDGSQLISVSEMSGTTQPTEDSRPGSGGPVGGSAWRAGGALLSELDSEEVSGSQQGASELSAPGVLEGTESTDDLGDGSLKGAIDMEGASAGSPDFEKVPDIPVNDFEEDEDDDEDRVCDMDVGSERADEPPRQRHDNDVEDDDDDDVEMASEGITESGLESYGNADEDDFVEDERLDNLNRVGQHPPPPPLLPSAPAAQWDQPNPWAEPPQQVQEADRAEESSSADTWQADSLTPTQAPAQAWLELGLGSFASDNQDQSQNLEAHLHVGTSNAAPESLFAPRVSLSGTLSSKSSTPEEQPQDLQAGVFSSNPELNYQALVAQMERRDGDGEEDEEAETLPADEVLGGPGTAPASNPSSSSSASEDEPSDTEGEAQLVDSSDGPIISHAAIDAQHASQRCLSTVEEGEEADMECAVEDTTPPSATSLASYGFDTVTTASNSNAHSTGESCIKSPGIFSLEELPDEAKKPGEALQPQDEPCLSEQQYIECGKQEDESADRGDDLGPKEALDPSSMPGIFLLPGETADDIQPPYYSAICEKTENSFTDPERCSGLCLRT
ncbi:titin homolog isoform X2 [Takifugu flavidus]|uniref:titin homolog isoform X2 n=1 Tax=Takifugu flavidus TaxID=433684 RepID=UPI002544CA66|nr:titin homolog isoform X2 [Takifugu flavidus]